MPPEIKVIYFHGESMIIGNGSKSQSYIIGYISYVCKASRGVPEIRCIVGRKYLFFSFLFFSISLLYSCKSREIYFLEKKKKLRE